MNATPPVLVGDVGGTTTRFAIARGHQLEAVVTWPTAEERTLRSGIARYAAGTGHTWTAAAVAVAGPVLGESARLTNADWSSTLEAFGGLEYDSCCWKLRVINRYWVDYNEFESVATDDANRGIFLQLVLKGLGSVSGNEVDSLLDDGIPGYREREDNAF